MVPSIDTQVTGIVSDSKNGIRGRAVWRDEPMVKKAFWGNFWESMGNIGQQYSTDYSTSPLGSVATIQAGKIPLRLFLVVDLVLPKCMRNTTLSALKCTIQLFNCPLQL